MKRFTVPFLKKTIILLFGVLLALSFVSCEYINLNIQDLVVEKLDNAVIESISFAYGTTKNANGQDCIFSNYYGGYRLDGTIRNPRGYNLRTRYDLNDHTHITQAYYNSEAEFKAALTGDYANPPTDVSYLMGENGEFSIYFSSAFLQARELDVSKRNIDGTITLFDVNTNREFDPYSFALRVNSTPQCPSGTTLQRNGDGTEYILCFYMPSTLTTDETMFDTHILDINGMKRYFRSYEDFDGYFYTDAAMTNVDRAFTTERPEDLRPLKDDGDLFEESDWGVSVYYSTGVGVTTAEKKWTIFIEDDEGLKSDTDYACNNEKTLTNPRFAIASGTWVNVNEDGLYILKVYHDGKCLDGTDVDSELFIYYTLFDENGEEKETSYDYCWSRDDGRYTEIRLNIGTYSAIRVWAKASHHTPSDRVSIYDILVKRPPALYVSSNGDDDVNNPGTINTPLRTINQAIERFTNAGVEEYKEETSFNIFVMDDITPEYSVEGDFVTIPYVTTSSQAGSVVKTFNIIGYEGNRTINAQRSSGATGSVIRVEERARLTMSNITLTGGYSTDGEHGGGGLSVETGANVSLTDCTITGNTATGSGGGISLSNSGITFQMNGCTISDNTSYGGGGGIFVMNPNDSVSISNCIISGNTTTSEYGGGIHIWQGSVVLNGCTLSGNTSPEGSTGGAIALRNQESASLKLDGATFIPAGNTGSDESNGVYVENGKSIEIGSNFTYSGAQALIDFPTYTQNATVFTGYPAKATGKFKPENAGFIITSKGKLSIDPDIYVSSSSSSPAGSSSGDGSQAHPYDSLTAAFDRIKTLDVSADYIIHVSGTIYPDGGLTITRGDFGTNAPLSVTICGTAANAADTINRNSGSATTVDVDGSVSFPVIFENLTITNGNAYGNGNNGGGLSLALDTNVTLKNCIVTGNSTDTSSGGLGGGIYVNGNLTLDGTSVTGNTSTANGGGIYVDASGILKIKGKVTVTGNTSGNSATTNNVYLVDSNSITIDGSLDSTSRIGVTTQSVPTAATATDSASTVTLTNGLSALGLTDDQIKAVFVSDDARYMVMKSTTGASQGEAALAVSGGSYSGGDIPNSNLTFAFTDAASNGNTVTSFFAGLPKDIYITVYEPGANDPIPASSIECTVELKSGARTFSTPGCTTVGNSKKITLPSTLYPDNYRLYVTAAYNGFTYDCSYPLECREHVSVGMVPVAGATITGAVSDSSVFIDGRTVTISNLYVSDHEVTQAEYFDVMGTNPSEFASGAASGETQENRPVEKVNWYAAIAYCNKLSLMEGLTPCYSVSGVNDWGTLPNTSIPTSSDSTWDAVTCNFNANGYRLPTEAEWEYLARGGNNGIPSTQTTYSGSSSIDSVAWYTTNSSNKTHEVKKKTANSLGIYDMSGNVYEWCWDWADEITATTGSSGPSSVPSAGNKLRSTRGGAYTNNSDRCRVYFRDNLSPQNKGQYLGFRVVRTR